MIYGLSHIVGEILGAQPTMNQAASSAEMTGQKLAQGGRFKCPRLGMLTREMCLENFMSGHLACTTGFDCGIGAGEARKEGIEVGYKDKYGDCDCGKTHVRLDKYGRCYKCQEAIREAARAERNARVLGTPPPVAPEAIKMADAPAEGIKAVQGHHEADDGQMVGPLAIDGMEFEPFTATRAKSVPTPMLSVQSGKVFSFNTGAIESFGLARFGFVELFASADRKAIAFKFSEDSPVNGRGVKATDSKDRLRKRIGAQGFMSAFGLDLKGKGPWPVEMPKPGVLVARVG